MSSSRYVGRHGRSRRRIALPSVAGSQITRTAVKSVAGVGIVLGSGAFVIAPSSAVGTSGIEVSALEGQQSLSATELLADRAEATGSTASRSAERSETTSVTAPEQESGQPDTGEVAVEAVAKPEPKPQPEESTESSTSDEPTSQSQSSGSDQTADSQAQQESASAPSGVQTGGYAAEAAAIGLGPNASSVYAAVRNQFPDMSNIGGYRAGDPGDHGSGRAVDIMVGSARGDQVAAWLQQNAGSLNIKYLIWKQRIWRPGSSWQSMEDRGSTTANHYDHVHVSVH